MEAEAARAAPQTAEESGGVEGLADAVAIALALHDVGGEEDRELARAAIWAAVTAWVEALGPLPYVPGLAEDLGRLVRAKLWDSGIGGAALREAMVVAGEAKEALALGRCDEALIERLESAASGLLGALGSGAGELLAKRLEGLGCEEKAAVLTSAIGLALVISTNI